MKIQCLIPTLAFALSLTALGQEAPNNPSSTGVSTAKPAALPGAGGVSTSSASTGSASTGLPKSSIGFGGGGGAGGGGMSGGYGMGGGAAIGGPKGFEYLFNSGDNASAAPLILRFSETDPAANAALEEDLNIMTRLVEKALERGTGDEARDVKMGIEMLLSSGSRSVRALYLEGFGACWMVKVNFPVFASLDAESKPKAAPPAADSEWDRAKRELYGGGEASLGGQPESKYNPQQVEALKKLLLQTMKNAANIRQLKPEEYVAFTVFGQPVSRMPGLKSAGTSENQYQVRLQQIVRHAQETRNEPADQARPVEENVKRELEKVQRETEKVQRYGKTLGVETSSGAAPGTVLTLRVKKADADAFASGKLDYEAFQKKAEIQAYPGNGYGLTSLNSWTKERATTLQRY